MYSKYLNSILEYILTLLLDINSARITLVRRLIEHSHSCNLHIHIGKQLRYHLTIRTVFHFTADIRKPTFKVGNQIVHERGHLTALDHPAVLEIARKYPNRPTINPVPVSY